MVENDRKLQFLYFRDILYKPSGRYTCQSSTASSHHASLSTQSQINTCPKGILDLNLGFNGLNWKVPRTKPYDSVENSMNSQT